MKSKTSFLLAEELIRQQIQIEGPMSFRRFMELALYHPYHGYYNQSSPRRGRSGDYFTSLQVSSLFPQIMAESFLQMWEMLGSEQFVLIEVGSGDGEFLEGVLKIFAQKKKLKGLRVWAVEQSRPARDHLWRKLSRFPRCQVVSSMDQIDWMGGMEGCIFSNELFDALPFHRLRRRSTGWQEVLIDLENGTLVEKEGLLTGFINKLLYFDDPGNLEEGHELEARPQISTIFEEWSSWISRGFVLTVDYGHPFSSFFSPLRAQGTWRCYKKHEMNKNALQDIGTQDITSHIDFTQLALEGQKVGFDPLLYCSQGIFLTHAGKDVIEQSLAGGQEQEKKKMIRAVQQLLHPEAMGENFWVLVQGKGMELPPTLKAIPSRLSRLEWAANTPSKT